MVICNGVRSVYQIKCQKGITFEATGDHLIMIPKVGKPIYKTVDDLKVGDKIVCKLSDIQNNCTNPLSRGIIALTAIILGDGNTTDKSPKFTCGNDELVESLKKILPSSLKLRKFNFKNNHVPDYYISNFKFSITKRANIFKQFLQHNNLWGKKAKEKFVPDIIFEQSQDNIALFLSYLYACDGWACEHSIGYCSTSYRLSQDVFLLLRRLGIRSTMQKKEFTNNWNTQYWILIGCAKDVIKFKEKIKTIPGKSKALDSVVEEANRRIGRRHNISVFSDKSKNPNLNINKPWVKIKSIQYIGEKEVYDITMEKTRSPRDNFLIQGGVVVHNCWEDEEPPYDFHEEQLPRLMAEDGDLLLSLTPANRLSWSYDEVFERAQLYIRTKAVCDFLRTPDYDPPQVEYTDSPHSIAVVQAATDDNPTLSKEAIEDKMSQYDDPDIIATRRFGVHKQVKGRIFKSFDYKVHFIDRDTYFPYGIPHSWNHARGIDYHPQTPWACGCMSLSPENEAFIWLDYNPSPEKYTTKEICFNFATQCKDYKFMLNLIDPLSEGIKKDKITILDDINREFHYLKHEGIGEGGYFVTWDTKGEKGRDEIRKRLKNSIHCERPYNNKSSQDGRDTYLPTIWILSNCKTAAKMMKMWRWEEYADTRFRMQKEDKNKPEDKWSHMNMVWEACCKHPSFRPPRLSREMRHQPPKRYFQGRR